MSEIPRRIVMYANSSGDPEYAAEFRWSPEFGVAVEALDNGWGRLALEYFENGVPDHVAMHPVAVSEGAAFMTTLANITAGSYYCFVVEEPSE
ncbi:hypothetical protein [Nocardia tengchongensis]|uniref:hypothetical protein n=1 Tax=Nocardia tengchongensis TaxID=2055889 RepID=UPI0036B4E17A